MSPDSARLLRRVSIVSQCALVLLGVLWAVWERPAPLVGIRWRDGLSPAERAEAERQLRLMNGEPADQAWRYELASPHASAVAAIVAHRDVRDTSRIDRRTKTLANDGAYGHLRIWWAGPFRGQRSAATFRVLFGVIAVLAGLSAWLSGGVRLPFRK